MIRTEGTLYAALETALKSCKEPVTCSDLYEIPVINRAAESANRVSDYLGNMWRRGQVLRYPAPRGSGASRWMYAWKTQSRAKKVLGAPLVAPTPFKAGPVEVIETTGEVHINLPGLQIIFRPLK